MLRKAYRAFDRRDLDAMLELLDDAFVFWTVTAEEVGSGEPYRGLEGMRRYFADVAEVWEEVRPTPVEFDVRGRGWVVVTGRVYARGRGRIVDSTAGWHWLLRDERIVYGRVFRSADEALATELGEG